MYWLIPQSELRNSTGALIASNDNWQNTIIGGIITHDQVQEIRNSGFRPGAIHWNRRSSQTFRQVITLQSFAGLTTGLELVSWKCTDLKFQH